MDVLLGTFAIAAAALATWLWWYRQRQRGAPGPKEWPVIGALPELIGNWDILQDWLTAYFLKTKSTVKLAFGFSVYGVYVVEPACVEYLLKTKFANYPKGPYNNSVMQDLFGDGIFNVDGEKWKQQRKVASFEFASSVLRDFSCDVFREYALKMVQILAVKAECSQPFDLQDLCMRMTLDTTCKVGFGVELGCLSPSLPHIPFSRCFDDANFISFHRYVDPLWKLKRFLSVGKERELKRCIQVLDSFTYTVIQERRIEMTKNELSEYPKSVRQDLLSRFMKLSNQGDERFTDKALRDIILNFIIAGRDTTAITLSWFFYMLSCHPEVAEKVFEEVSLIDQQFTKVNTAEEDHIGLAENAQFTAFAELLTYETLGKMTYLQAALSETLRLYPPVPLDGKHAEADDVLPDGTKVKKRFQVGYVPYAMGRMEHIWGPDALEFKPERWLKNGVYQAESPFKFTAFQAGPRMCLGKDSAYLQMKLTAALVLRFFRFHLVPGHPVTYRVMLVLTMLHGLQVTVSVRDKPQFLST